MLFIYIRKNNNIINKATTKLQKWLKLLIYIPLNISRRIIKPYKGYIRFFYTLGANNCELVFKIRMDFELIKEASRIYANNIAFA